MVTLLLPAILAERAQGRRLLHGSGTTVGEVLDDLARDHAELVGLIRGPQGLSRFMNLYVNDADVRGAAGLRTPVAAGDEISVIPAVAGG